VLLARQACAFPIYGIYISLSWIISCAKRKALFSKQIFCLEIGSEIIVKIYFQNISNLLRYGLFLFCELDIILVQIFKSPCHQLYIYKEGAKPNWRVVHAVLCFCLRN
jgi:hypothetical protein